MDTFEAVIRCAVASLILFNLFLPILKEKKNQHKHFYGFPIFSPVTKTAVLKGPLHDELDPIKKV